MKGYTLPSHEVQRLRAEHGMTLDKRLTDRIKVVIALGSGWSAKQVAEVLLIDPDTAREYFKRYRRGGIQGLLRMEYRGSDGWLNDEQLVELDLHLQQKLYLTAKDVVRLVKDRWGIDYSERGITALLRRLGYVYKKPKLVPGKANAEAQKRFVETYEKLKENKAPEDPIYFMDATHPRHNPVLGYGWIKRGRAREIPSNTGRDRLNINGAIDLERLQPVVRFDDTVNAASTIALFEQLEAANPASTSIYIICDNTRYYRSKEVRSFLEDSKIELVFLPPYSPNLNSIERYWKFFKKRILYDTYYETFSKFKQACAEFFRNSNAHVPQLRSLLTKISKSSVIKSRNLAFRWYIHPNSPYVNSARRKCLHIYYYFMGREFGLVHVQIQTWFPLRMQVFVNGHDWLARKLDTAGIKYTQCDNVLVWIDDVERAQRFSDRMSGLDWPSILNRFARRANPLMGSLLGGMEYYWVTAQCEYATDVMFKSAACLKELYQRLISHSTLCFGAKEVMSFLGKKLVGQFRGEQVSDVTDRCKRRLPGVRIKHRVKMNWIKMYDNAGSVLRVEMVINDPEAFKVRRQVKRGQKQVTQWVPMSSPFKVS